MEPSHVDPRYIDRVLRTLCVGGDVIEVRILGVHYVARPDVSFCGTSSVADSARRPVSRGLFPLCKTAPVCADCVLTYYDHGIDQRQGIRLPRYQAGERCQHLPFVTHCPI